MGYIGRAAFALTSLCSFPAYALDSKSTIGDWYRSSGSEQMEMARVVASASATATDTDVVDLMFCVEKAAEAYSPDDKVYTLAQACWVLMNRQ